MTMQGNRKLAESPTIGSGGPSDSSSLRALVATGMLGIALIHVLDLPGKIEETPYLGWLFILASISSLLVAWALTQWNDRRLLLAAAGIAAMVMLGYVVSRSIGLPDATDDIGNWFEPLGLASLFVEGVIVFLAVSGLIRRSAA